MISNKPQKPKLKVRFAKPIQFHENTYLFVQLDHEPNLFPGAHGPCHIRQGVSIT